MGSIFDSLETEIIIDGVTYEVDMSFDNVLELIEVLENPKVDDVKKVYIGILILLGKELQLQIDEQMKVFEVLLKEFVQDENQQKIQFDLEGNQMPLPKQEISYDLRQDASYIYTSFVQAYGIDLYEQRGKLDWRKFKQLLRDLPDDTKFKQVIDIRTRPFPKGKHAVDERKRLKEMKRVYALSSDNGEL